jgi:anti-sigma B factor antagonist
MAIRITDRVLKGVAVVTIEGRIVLGEETNALRETVRTLLATGQKKILLNMENVTYVDSSGLGTLVASHASAQTQGASLKLCNLSPKIKELLLVTKLVTVFEFYDSEEEAINSFSK